MTDYGRIRDQIVNECYLIKKGVRSCFLEVVSGPKETIEYEDEIVELSIAEKLFKLEQVVVNEGLMCRWYKREKDQYDDPDEEYYSFWICRYTHQLAVINAVEASRPWNFLTQWIVGKLLGYSDQSMEEFLVEKVMDDLTLDKRVLNQEEE